MCKRVVHNYVLTEIDSSTYVKTAVFKTKNVNPGIIFKTDNLSINRPGLEHLLGMTFALSDTCSECTLSLIHI